MRKPRTKAEWEAFCDESVNDLLELRRHGFSLLDRDRHVRQDGYPTSSLPGALGSGYSDPVGNLVAYSHSGGDELHDSAERIWKTVNDARGLILDAFRAMVKGLNLPLPEMPYDANAGCLNCKRYGEWNVVEKQGRCPACRKWRQRHDGEERPGSEIARTSLNKSLRDVV